ncbi:helix-turn-helix transcriptional regulator [Thermosediminibacter litoriperuensis]|uniref:Putative transcriptional regulator n=1 Tax=Thermosediminibacter litoriperuensis TaxID=291989 RepID=A0A5S5AV92_9FIRM|nr:putative transcriptional regulator [Thermosediminibacter litoriperuensis]
MGKISLKDLRKQKGVTQSTVAEFLGISVRYYSMLETGRRTPGFLLARRIADYYGVKIDDINFFGSK